MGGEEGVLRLQSSNVGGPHLALLPHLDHGVLVLLAEFQGHFLRSQGEPFTRLGQVHCLVPVRFVERNILGDGLAEHFPLPEGLRVERILGELQFVNLLPLQFLLSLEGLEGEIEALEGVFYVGLAVLGHVGHPVEEGKDPVLVLPEDFCHPDHVVFPVEEGVVEDELENLLELLTVLAVPDLLGIEGDPQRLAEHVPHVGFYSQLLGVAVDAALELVQLLVYLLPHPHYETVDGPVAFLDFEEGPVLVDFPHVAVVVIDELVEADDSVVLG